MVSTMLQIFHSVVTWSVQPAHAVWPEARLQWSQDTTQENAARSGLDALHALFWINLWLLHDQEPFAVTNCFAYMTSIFSYITQCRAAIHSLRRWGPHNRERFVQSVFLSLWHICMCYWHRACDSELELKFWEHSRCSTTCVTPRHEDQEINQDPSGLPLRLSES